MSGMLPTGDDHRQRSLPSATSMEWFTWGRPTVMSITVGTRTRHAGPSPPMGDLMYKVCSTPGCPHLVSSDSLCDECRKAKDKRRSRGRNPYTSKAHRLARARVLARDPRCVCPGDGPDGCGRHHGLCGAPSTIADHWPLERVELIEAGLDPNDPARMRGLCKRCHDSKTARTKPSGFNGRSLR